MHARNLVVAESLLVIGFSWLLDVCVCVVFLSFSIYLMCRSMSIRCLSINLQFVVFFLCAYDLGLYVLFSSSCASETWYIFLFFFSSDLFGAIFFFFGLKLQNLPWGCSSNGGMRACAFFCLNCVPFVHLIFAYVECDSFVYDHFAMIFFTFGSHIFLLLFL